MNVTLVNVRIKSRNGPLFAGEGWTINAKNMFITVCVYKSASWYLTARQYAQVLWVITVYTEV